MISCYQAYSAGDHILQAHFIDITNCMKGCILFAQLAIHPKSKLSAETSIL